MSSRAHGNVETRLAIYTAIAGALAAGTAHAAPVYSPNTPLTLTDTTDGDGGEYVGFDIDGDGTNDLDLYVQFNTSCPYNDGYAYFQNAYTGAFIERSNSSYAGMIAPGTAVSSAMTWGTTSYLAACGTSADNFPVPSRGFVAVQFRPGLSDATHYGYLDVETAAGSVEVTIHEACWETEPRTSIDVGACRPPAPIPVGGAIPLTLGVLALGAAALRRRRQTV